MYSLNNIDIKNAISLIVFRCYDVVVNVFDILTKHVPLSIRHNVYRNCTQCFCLPAHRACAKIRNQNNNNELVYCCENVSTCALKMHGNSRYENARK